MRWPPADLAFCLCITQAMLFMLIHVLPAAMLLPVQEVARVWSNQPYNFDHLGMALISLFVTVTLNGYKGDALRAAREGGG